MLLQELFEAKISGANVPAAMSKIISYLERKLGVSLRKLGVETFKNSAGTGTGIRYLEDGTTNCFRFNWVGGRSSEIVSVDIWNGTQKDPNFNVRFKGTSLAKSLPTLASVLLKPRLGAIPVREEELTEAKKGEWDPVSSIQDMVQKLEQGRTFNRSEFVMMYHPENAYAYDQFIEHHRDQLKIEGKRISLPKGEKLGQTSADTAKPSEGASTSAASLEVSRGGRSETYATPELKRIEETDRVTFSDALEDLEGLTKGLMNGSFNALFVAGRGGTGKTQTVETTLEEGGLTDGSGYFKITGSSSPIGIYSALYKNKDGIILFDDCDGALESQDGRNLIKAATDTKKVRKVAWAKKSAGMYDPEDRDAAQAAKSAAQGPAKNYDDNSIDFDMDDEAGGEDEVDMYADKLPRHFNFTGRVIFISNLPMNKLDPDGALRTRAFVIAVDPTPEEIFERMGEIVNDIRLENGTLNEDERQEVLEVVKSSKKANDASLRTLVRALNLRASGAPNWKRLCLLYA